MLTVDTFSTNDHIHDAKDDITVTPTTTCDAAPLNDIGPFNIGVPISVISSHDTASSTTLTDKDDAASPQLSTIRVLIAHVGAALTLFLATTDANIVSTSLPTISKELNASQTQYTWVGVAYMLSQTALQPFYGRISDILGRKTLLFASVAVFALGSLLCGASKSIEMLIASRALAGIGGGGIVSSVWVITAEIVPIHRRAKWSSALSITWSASAIAGPVVGGLFSGGTDTGLSWRWGFYINLPICFLASIVLVLSLRGVQLQRSPDTSLRTILEKFDFIGLLLFMIGTTSIVFGFSFANQNGWLSKTTVLTLVLGLVILICGGVYETRTTRDTIFPPSVFTNATAVIILVIVFLHNFAFTSGTFYLAFFFQTVDSYTPLQAGLQLLPFSLGSSLASMPAAWFIEYWQHRRQNSSGQNIVISFGLVIATLGFGLFILLDAQTSRIQEVFYPLIAGVGMGFLFHAPYQLFIRSLKPQELAGGTSAFFLVRFTGATIGLAVSGAILYARAAQLLPPGFDVSVAGALEDLQSQPPKLRLEILRALATSIQTIWMVCTPFLGLSLLISLMLKKVPLINENVLDVNKSEVGTV